MTSQPPYWRRYRQPARPCTYPVRLWRRSSRDRPARARTTGRASWLVAFLRRVSEVLRRRRRRRFLSRGGPAAPAPPVRVYFYSPLAGGGRSNGVRIRRSCRGVYGTRRANCLDAASLTEQNRPRSVTHRSRTRGERNSADRLPRFTSLTSSSVHSRCDSVCVLPFNTDVRHGHMPKVVSSRRRSG